MIEYELKNLKSLRKKFHLTQKELASRSGASQSLIAKMECGRVNPSYSAVRSIFSALEQCREKQETKASQLMQREVITASGQELVRNIIGTMRRRGISQVPVLQQGRICGIITEGTILRHLAEKPERVAFLRAREVMEEAPPVISPATGQQTILALLQEYPVVLVAEKGELRGIISKTDVLGRV